MRIRVWRAYASNNSGSYTLVGRFHDDDQARAISEALARLVAEQSAWLEGRQSFSEAEWEASPLAAFHREHGLAWTARSGDWDDWPEHGPPPSVVAVGHQVVVHAPYTVTLVDTFASYVVARAGRIQIELDHSHSPLVCAIECWWPHDQNDKPVEAVRAAVEASPAFREARTQPWKPDSPHPFLWRDPDDWMGPPLLLAAIFEDVVAGVAAVADVVRGHGGAVVLRVVESENPAAPLAAFERRVRLVIDQVGPRAIDVAKVLVKHFALSAHEAHALVDRSPVLLGEWPQQRARELEAELAAAGAVVAVLPVPVPADD